LRGFMCLSHRHENIGFYFSEILLPSLNEYLGHLSSILSHVCLSVVHAIHSHVAWNF
jgi:hypothetical protein